MRCVAVTLVCLLATVSARADDRFDVFFVAVGSGEYAKSRAPDVTSLDSFDGAARSATAIADLLRRGGSRFGVTLVSASGRFVSRGDIFNALARVGAVMAKTKARHPLLVFYFTGHGFGEGLAWNHFSLPGDFVYRGDLASLDLAQLATVTLHTASLVAQLRDMQVPFVVLLDTCYEGEPDSFIWKPVISGPPPDCRNDFSGVCARIVANVERSGLRQLDQQMAATAVSLNQMAASMRQANRFETTYPVLFSAAPGSRVLTVSDPRDGNDNATAIGPLARRAILIFDRALAEHGSLSLQAFLTQMTSPQLDPQTQPAVTGSPIPSDAGLALAVPSAAPGVHERRVGTATRASICCGEAARVGPAPGTATSASAGPRSSSAPGKSAAAASIPGDSREAARAGLDPGKPVDGLDPWGQTALMNAATVGNNDLVERLLERHANVNFRSDKAGTALIQAAAGGHPDTVALLIKHGADVNGRGYNDETPLIRAALHGRTDVARVLLDAGAHVDDVDSLQRTALIAAARYAAAETEKLLIDHGAKVDSHDALGGTPLILAAASGDHQKVAVLLDAGAAVDLADRRGTTALIAAAQKGPMETVTALLKAHAAVNAITDTGMSALMLASWKGDLRIVDVLLDAHANIRLASKDGRTALHMAAYVGRADVASLLLKRGADIRARTNDGETAFFMAALSGQDDVVRLLLDGGANVRDKDSLGRPALVMAASQDHLSTVRLLIERGARDDVNWANADGNTPLIGVVTGAHPNPEMVRLLVSAGANMRAKDRSGKTALDWAVYNNLDEIGGILRAEEGRKR